VVKICIVDFMATYSLVRLLAYRISEHEDGGSLYLRKLGTCPSCTPRPRRLYCERLLLTSNVLFYIVIYTPLFHLFGKSIFSLIYPLILRDLKI
jgi:hypothetical protein